jgi:hypothetical protein
MEGDLHATSRVGRASSAGSRAPGPSCRGLRIGPGSRFERRLLAASGATGAKAAGVGVAAAGAR